MYMIPRLSANLECRRANICPESALGRNLALSVAGRIGPWSGLLPEVWLHKVACVHTSRKPHKQGRQGCTCGNGELWTDTGVSEYRLSYLAEE